MGALKETYPCNPSPMEPTPSACGEQPPVDCMLGFWADWSSCTSTCGGGEHTRSRTIVQHPKNGGKACEGPLARVAQCNNIRCPGPLPVDCQLGEWQDWGECTQCSGERTRFREITQYAEHGGKPCDAFDQGREWSPLATSEVAACPRQCEDKKFCVWADWQAWGQCTQTCGQGKRARRRDLGLSSVPVAPLPPTNELMGKYSKMQAEIIYDGTRRTQELVAAFACGFLSFVVALVGIRAFSASRNRTFDGEHHRLAVESPKNASGALNSKFNSTYHQLDERNATELPLVGSA